MLASILLGYFIRVVNVTKNITSEVLILLELIHVHKASNLVITFIFFTFAVMEASCTCIRDFISE